MKKRILALCMAVVVCLTSAESGVTVYAGQNGENVEEVVDETEEAAQDTEESIQDTETEMEETIQNSATEQTVQNTETEMEETVQNSATEQTVQNTEAEEEAESTEDMQEDMQEYFTEAGGYIPLPIEEDIPALDEDDLELCQAGLPSYYRTSKLPAIRNQNPYGTCWAFVSIALAELSVLKNSPQKDADSVDFSELHTAYFANYSQVDPLRGTEGDKNVFTSKDKDFLGFGGNLALVMYAYENWLGAADETTAPYENAEEALESGVDASLAYEDVAHMKNAYIVSIQKNPEAVKTLVQELGGVGISFSVGGEDVYNSENKCYYNPIDTPVNHAVAIVGWDDNFSKEKFTQQPKQNGAWLIRNSWGANEETDSGYFWLSYEDATIGDAAYAFDFVGNDSEEYYDNNYQYDGSEFSNYIGNGTDTLPVANVFTVKNSNQVLKAISFETGIASEDYTVQIYRNLADETDPESGMLVDTVSGRTTYQGMYTVKLSKDIYFTKDETFSVVVTLKNENDFAVVATEMTTGIHNWINCIASSKKGQSFRKTGDAWEDYGASGSGNIRIKAYTNNVTGTVAVTGLSVSAKEKTIRVGGKTNVIAMVSPSNATDQRVTWSTSNESVATVTQGGLVKGVAGGEAVITAVSADKKYKASVTITVDAKILTGISIKETEPWITRGDKVQMEVVYAPANTTSDKTVTWSCSNTKVAKISSKGLVTAIAAGNVTITAKVGEFTASYNLYIEESDMDCKPMACTDNTVKLSWDAQKGADGYYIYRYQENGYAYDLSTRIQIKDGAAVSYQDKKVNISKEEPYYYQVRAYYMDGDEEMFTAASDIVEVRYYVRYSLNGGTNDSENPTYFTASNTGYKYTLREPTRKGYTFAGWYSDSSYKNKITSLTSKAKILSVYAKWTENQYAISFQGNGSSSGSMSKMTKLKYSKSYTLTKNAFKKKGYKFTGWNTKADGSGKTYKNAASIAKLTATNGKTVKLYAQWKKVSYTITYNLNSGKNSSKNPSKYTVTTATIKLAKPTRKGYTFVGWYSDKSYKTKVTQIKKGTIGNKTLYAKWKKSSYTITYKLNKGKNSKKNPAKYTVTTATIKLAKPTRKGYTFVGWYSDKSCKKKVTQIKKGSTGNKTLYAKWKKK